MKRKLLVAVSAAVFIIAIAITILGHCGSTWVALDPTFEPNLTRSNCTTGGARTTTKKISRDNHTLDGGSAVANSGFGFR
jgi:hypothetical protein